MPRRLSMPTHSLGIGSETGSRIEVSFLEAARAPDSKLLSDRNPQPHPASLTSMNDVTGRSRIGKGWHPPHEADRPEFPLNPQPGHRASDPISWRFFQPSQTRWGIERQVVHNSRVA